MTETPIPSNPLDPKAQAKADKAYKKAMRPWYMKKRFWVLGVIGIFLIAGVAGGGDDSGSSNTASSPSSSDSSEESTKAVEPAVKVTASELISALESNALAASKEWEGKRVELTGKFDSVDASGDYFTLAGDDEWSFTNVQIFIKEEMVDTVAGFKPDQKVTVVGTITGVGEILGYSIKAESVK